MAKSLQEHLEFFVGLQDTIKGFKGLVEGEFDNIPESAFYMVGTIEEAIQKSKKEKADFGVQD